MRARWLAIVLAVSVALNLFFLGLLSARAFQRWGAQVERPPHAQGGPRRMRQRPRPFHWMSEDEREALRPRRRAVRTSRREVARALRAEPFDREGLSEALSGLRRDTSEIQSHVHELLLERAARMSSEERQRLADSQWQWGERH